MAFSPLVVLDDDPTGTQAVAGVPVLLRWTAETIRRAARDGARSIHLSTNSRAMDGEQARGAVRAAATAARAALPEAPVLLRGDSTLRAHLIEEYRGLVEATGDGTAVLLLVPALPDAGRVTIGGMHFLRRGPDLVPLHDTEYAIDGAFAYRDAALLQWAEDRSDGFFPRADGLEIPLAGLRAGGPEVVEKALNMLCDSGRPAVCAPDAETMADLETIARGWRAAHQAGCRVVVRCAPAFAGVAAGTVARSFAASPTASDGTLVICGSHVPLSTRQLTALVEEHPGTLVEVDVVALAGAHPKAEVERAVRAVAASLADSELAVLATPRQRPPGTESLDAGERIAENVACIVATLPHLPSVVVTKGGITSAVIARDGLGADRANVVVPVTTGVALWRISATQRHEPVSLLVVPGNVGDDRLLTELVARVRDRPPGVPC